MKSVLPAFEQRAESVIPFREFALRLAHSGALVVGLVAASLFIGMLGYHVFEGLSWIDAFLNAAMLLGGMGPVQVPTTFGGKLFCGFYALYCGLVVIFAAGLMLAPMAHRILHKFHMEGRKR